MMGELVWHAPGPGRWARERAERRGLTWYLRDAYRRSMIDGTAPIGVRYGLPFSHVDARCVHDRAYSRAIPLGEKNTLQPVLPRPLLWLLLRVHPEMRRRARAAEHAFATRIWRDDDRRWRDEQRPATVAANLALQDIDVSALDDDALAAHVDQAVSRFTDAHRLHIELHGLDMPVGDFVATAAAEWNITPTQSLALLRGMSPESAFVDATVTRLREVMAPMQASALTFDAVRASSPGAAEAVDDFLRHWGWRVVGSFDVDGLTVNELGPNVVRSVSVPVEHRPGVDAQTVRDRVPAVDRGRFDDLLAEACIGYGGRDDNVGVCAMWPVGLNRRALLEVGRRLVARQRIQELEDIFDVQPAEIRALLAGEPVPTADELHDRAVQRAIHYQLEAPETIGDEPDPPPTTVFPTGMGRAVTAIFTYLDLIDRPVAEGGDLEGTGIGDAPYTGPARVVRDAEAALLAVTPGDVLVASFTTPGYNAVLPMAGALVTEEGGPLSHGAIAARELGIVAVIGARRATEVITDGMSVTVDPRAGRVRLEEPA